MAEIVNLRRYRKEKTREEKKARAAEQRVNLGRDKNQKLREAREIERQRDFIESKKLDKDED